MNNEYMVHEDDIRVRYISGDIHELICIYKPQYEQSLSIEWSASRNKATILEAKAFIRSLGKAIKEAEKIHEQYVGTH